VRGKWKRRHVVPLSSCRSLEAGELVEQFKNSMECQNPPNGIYKANWDVRGAGCGSPTDGHRGDSKGITRD
jgi:hypothetical protein